jgi:hypothetical protein
MRNSALLKTFCSYVEQWIKYSKLATNIMVDFYATSSDK